MDELIAKLEAADRGSDELDAAFIAHLIGGKAERSKFNGRWCVYRGTDKRGEEQLWRPQNKFEEAVRRIDYQLHGPTRSIEAALVVVPSDLVWATGNINEDDVPWACLTDAHGTDFAASATTPALALCIAALKARVARAKQAGG